MRKLLILALCGGLAAATRADLQPYVEQLVAEQNVDWEVNDAPFDGPMNAMPAMVRGRPLSDVQMQSQIRTALQQPRTGTDLWTWRDAVEERLLALGRPAIALMHAEIETREGYEADALAVAIFRIENAPLNPNESLKQWGAKRFPGPAPDTLKCTRVPQTRRRRRGGAGDLTDDGTIQAGPDDVGGGGADGAGRHHRRRRE